MVERIFRAYAQEGASLGSVARELNQDGIPRPKQPAWDNVPPAQILHSLLYAMTDEDIYRKG